MKKNIVIPLLVLLAAGVLLAGKGVSVLRGSGSKVDALVNADIDMSRLNDGVYTGSCDSGLVNAEVRIEVKDHKIVGIELVKHDHLKGKPAEAILEEMIRQNTDDVDAVSGATISSKVIRNAVNTALQNGMARSEKLPESGGCVIASGASIAVPEGVECISLSEYIQIKRYSMIPNQPQYIV